MFFYDANRNVGQLVDPNAASATASIQAKYEYDPYGDNLLDPNHVGPYGLTNPIRFSTKYFDNETGLGYWGERYYNAKLGRWMNRDPANEVGGLNVYAYSANEPAGKVDRLGEQAEGWFTPHGLGCTRRKPPPDCSDCWQTCSSPAGQALLGGQQGKVLCRPDGCWCACVNTGRYPGGPPGSHQDITKRCALAHEEAHIQDLKQKPSWCTACIDSDGDGLGTVGVIGLCGGPEPSECVAHPAEAACLAKALRNGECKDARCRRLVQSALVNTAIDACTSYGCRIDPDQYADVLDAENLAELRKHCHKVAPARQETWPPWQ